jgi:hypothetical protein
MNSHLSPEAILQQMAQIQRMDRGCVSIIRQGPQGPYHNHQCYEGGRNVSRYVPAEQLPELQAALQGHRRFQELVEQYVQLVVERTRAERKAGVKKKEPSPDFLLAQEQEIQQLMIQFEAQAPTGVDVQKLEVLVRTAVFKPANAVVGYLLQAAADRLDAAYQARPGQVRKGRETIGLQCLFGTFDLTRDYYYQAGKQQGHYPADAALGLEVGYTPALARLIGLEGADAASYQKAETHLAETGGITVAARQIQRVVQRVGEAAQAWQAREFQPQECAPCDAPVLYVSADGTGAPMRRAELVGRVGKQPDGTAKTRQVYLGCVFTQHRTDEQGHPVRDWESTTYVSSLEPIAVFGPLLRQEALRRGMGTAQRVVLLIDGADGLENMGRLCFAGCLQIVDFYHALEHAGQVLEALLGSKQHPAYKTRQHRWAKRLLQDGVEALIAQTRREATTAGRGETVEQELGYFVRNVVRMQYGTFRQQGFFIGSGVIEAGCKSIIGARCKQSGMFWSQAGAENILAFRCIHASRRLDQFWKHRLGQHAARNDALPLAA